MLNKVILIGRLTKDIELRYTQSGIATASFTLAVNRNFKSQSGEKEADFIPVVAWRAQAENCAKYLAKGRLVAVSGRIQTRSYDAQDGTKRYVTEVVADEVTFLEWGESNSGRGTGQDRGQAVYDDDVPGFNTAIEDDQELPF